MKTKYFALISLLLIVAVFLGGCASGLTAGGWPGMTADANNAYLAGGPYVYAVNLQTGVQTWRFPDKASAANPFFATPVFTPDGGQLIVGGFDKKLYSLDPKTGKSSWTFADARDRWIGGVLTTDKMIYAANADYKLYALNLQGSLQWSFEADQAIWGAPVSDGTNIYFGTLGRKVYAVDAQTGKQTWVQTVDGAVLGSPVMGKDNTVYVGTYGGTIYAMNTANGESRWLKKTTSWIWSGPVLDGTDLYVGDANGKFFAYPLAGSGQAWTQALSGAIVGSPLVNGDNIIVGTEAGSVYFMDLAGKSARPIAISGKVYATPVAAGALVLVAPTAGDATLIALDQTGAIKWSFIPPK
jgi:eukaryotic-like serine/threonine-protein kinase